MLPWHRIIVGTLSNAGETTRFLYSLFFFRRAKTSQVQYPLGCSRSRSPLPVRGKPFIITDLSRGYYKCARGVSGPVCSDRATEFHSTVQRYPRVELGLSATVINLSTASTLMREADDWSVVGGCLLWWPQPLFDCCTAKDFDDVQEKIEISKPGWLSLHTSRS